ncbi:unnamed protein product [Ectocarpus sp. 8 AP-2014]
MVASFMAWAPPAPLLRSYHSFTDVICSKVSHDTHDANMSRSGRRFERTSDIRQGSGGV